MWQQKGNHVIYGALNAVQHKVMLIAEAICAESYI